MKERRGRPSNILIAKRLNNQKRSYLLVNSLQAKHLPVSPSAALAMMERLGEGLVRRAEPPCLAAAFAETATAVGAAAAKTLGDDTLFMTTTREPQAEGRWIEFLEEHSHARQHMLCADGLEERIARSGSVILLDDEFSTGKTLRNMFKRLKEEYPAILGKSLIAASLLNRLSDENAQRLLEEGIGEEALWKIPEEDYTPALAQIDVCEAEPVSAADAAADIERLRWKHSLPDPRRGVVIGVYDEACRRLNEDILGRIARAVLESRSVLVLGTEECMYPAILMGSEIERRFPGIAVYSQATTRSPIGISTAAGYPIREGRRLPSLYDEERVTYIYNLAHYDTTIIVTDAKAPGRAALSALSAALCGHGKTRIILVEAG